MLADMTCFDQSLLGIRPVHDGNSGAVIARAQAIMEVSYTLKDIQSGNTVWTRDINSEYTAKASAAFAGVGRLRLANEGAARPRGNVVLALWRRSPARECTWPNGGFDITCFAP
jgi:hypothetical protein